MKPIGIVKYWYIYLLEILWIFFWILCRLHSILFVVFLSVNPFMFGKLSFLLEGFAALLAKIGLQPWVYPKMILKIAFLIKLFAADATNEDWVQPCSFLLNDLSLVANESVNYYHGRRSLGCCQLLAHLHCNFWYRLRLLRNLRDSLVMILNVPLI